MSGTTIHLRAESKPLEYRSALTPRTTKALLDAGYTVNVERSALRIFEDHEFSDVGATLVPEGSWVSAPCDHIILGLKELPEETFPLTHTHVQFAHCYKGQDNWQEVLARFPAGGGTLLDLEFLQDEKGRRVAAFGYHAGFAGAALAILVWAWQLTHPKGEPLPGVKPFAEEEKLLHEIRSALQEGKKVSGRYPQILIIGALGRCGTGAVELCQKVGLPDNHILKWDMAETAKGGPFLEIVESDIFVNCIYLATPIPPFVDAASLKHPKRRLSTICDVSCDITNPNNPIPCTNGVVTTFEHPAERIEEEPSLSIITIDHLPSLLPKSASETFSSALLPSLLSLKDRKSTRVWQQAEDLFNQKVTSLPREMVNGKA